MRTRTLVPVLLALAATNCTSTAPEPPGGGAGGAPITNQPPANTAGTHVDDGQQQHRRHHGGHHADRGDHGHCGQPRTGISGMGGGMAPAGGAGGTGPEPQMAFPDPRGKCDINSGFPDDRACLLPPAAGRGHADPRRPDRLQRPRADQQAPLRARHGELGVLELPHAEHREDLLPELRDQRPRRARTTSSTRCT